MLAHHACNHPQQGERNYHCFYFMLAAARDGRLQKDLQSAAGAPADLRQQWVLNAPSSFHYLRCEGEHQCYQVAGIDDGATYSELVQGLYTLRLGASTQLNVSAASNIPLASAGSQTRPLPQLVRNLHQLMPPCGLATS